MERNVCGKCEAFKPKPGALFFNCTQARHYGLTYGMQVREDTQACDAFVLNNPGPAPKPAPSQERVEPAGAPPRTRMIIIAGIVVTALIILGLLSCSLHHALAPGPTGPVATAMPTTAPSVTPSLAPAYTTQYFDVSLSQWATSPTRAFSVCCLRKTSSYTLLTNQVVSAPPGTEFVFLNVSTLNPGHSVLHTSASDFALSNAGGITYTSALYGNYYVGNPYPTEDLAPGEIASGTLLWLVPNIATDIELSCLVDPKSTPPVMATWKLP